MLFQVRVGVFRLSTNREKTCFIVFCAEILKQLSPMFTKRLPTSCVFLSHRETLHFTPYKEFCLIKTKKRHRNFSDLLFLLYSQFSAKFLICSQTFINLKHIQKLQILYEFDVRFHTKVRNPICHFFFQLSCAKHASAGALLIHRQLRHFIEFLLKQN